MTAALLFVGGIVGLLAYLFVAVLIGRLCAFNNRPVAPHERRGDFAEAGGCLHARSGQ
jgi:hypothetical protein